MFFFVFVFARRLTDMGAEDVQRVLTQVFPAFRQARELVSAAHAHSFIFMP